VLARQLELHALPELWREHPVPYERLPAPTGYPDRDLGDVLLARRTHRPWTGRSLTSQHLSRVLLDANAPLVKSRLAAEREFRKRPSALLENLYGDLETYVVAYDVDGLAPGLYHYDPRDHQLGRIRSGCLREQVCTAFVGQEAASAGSCSLLITAVWKRHMVRYANNPRGYRTLMMLVGQLAQRYLVGWTAFGFRTFPTPAHYPELTDSLLGTDRFVESGIYLLTAG
jgi:SagB-type dehydrogenase family enzyme